MLYVYERIRRTGVSGMLMMALFFSKSRELDRDRAEEGGWKGLGMI